MVQTVYFQFQSGAKSFDAFSESVADNICHGLLGFQSC